MRLETSGTLLEKIKCFLYDGTIGPFDNEVEMMEIESFAQKYHFDDLAKYCTNQIDLFVTIENCFELYFKYRNPNIENACIKVMIKNFMEVGHRAEFIKIPATFFEKILESEELVTSEDDIFLVFLKWYHELPTFKFEMDSLTFQNRTDADIVRVLEKIRFPLISLDVNNKNNSRHERYCFIDQNISLFFFLS